MLKLLLLFFTLEQNSTGKTKKGGIWELGTFAKVTHNINVVQKATNPRNFSKKKGEGRKETKSIV